MLILPERLAGFKRTFYLFPVCDSGLALVPFRAAIVNSCHGLEISIGNGLRAVSHEIRYHATLGIGFICNILVSAFDVWAIVYSVLPIDLPQLVAPERITIVPHRIILAITLDRCKGIEEGAKGLAGCIDIGEGWALDQGEEER